MKITQLSEEEKKTLDLELDRVLRNKSKIQQKIDKRVERDMKKSRKDMAAFTLFAEKRHQEHLKTWKPKL